MTVIHPKRRPNDVPSLGVKYICDSCHADISHVVRIRCAECPEIIDLCVECFSERTEIKPNHLPSHSYQVIEPFSFPIYDSSWRADEELLLVEGALNVGLGNWLDISSYIGTKSSRECEIHYFDLYINSTSFPLPDQTIPLPSKIPIPLPDQEHASKLADPEYHQLTSQPANHEIAGYMPYRHDFETEFDQDAELLVKDLIFNTSEDRPLDVSFKLAMLESYNDILDKRKERKRFIENHDFLEFKKYLALEKHRSKEEKQILSKLMIYQRFMSAHDFELFQKGFIEESKLVKRISKLQEYRRQGIRDFDTAAAYDTELLQLSHSQSGIDSAPPSMSSSGGSINRHTNILTKTPPKPSLTTISPLFSTIPSVNIASRLSDITIPICNTQPGHVTTRSSNIQAPMVRRSLGQPLDISDAEGIELLSSTERNICSILRIMPRVYLCIKETFIAAYHKHGYLKRAQARGLVKIDVNKTSKLYDFFVSSGWISPTPELDVDHPKPMEDNPETPSIDAS